MADEPDGRYRGRVVDVDVERVTLPNGHVAELELVHHPGGAAVVALDDADRVCMLRQYRHAVEGWLWELPAGKLEPDEPPMETARRELLEEAGVTAATWTRLGEVVSSPGVFTEVIHLFAARGLTFGAADTGDHEVLEVHWVGLDEALAWARDGTIRDAKTLVGLCRLGLHGA